MGSRVSAIAAGSAPKVTLRSKVMRSACNIPARMLAFEKRLTLDETVQKHGWAKRAARHASLLYGRKLSAEKVTLVRMGTCGLGEGVVATKKTLARELVVHADTLRISEARDGKKPSFFQKMHIGGRALYFDVLQRKPETVALRAAGAIAAGIGLALSFKYLTLPFGEQVYGLLKKFDMHGSISGIHASWNSLCGLDFQGTLSNMGKACRSFMQNDLGDAAARMAFFKYLVLSPSVILAAAAIRWAGSLASFASLRRLEAKVGNAVEAFRLSHRPPERIRDLLFPERYYMGNPEGKEE
jgi:hypothetical protein